MPITILYFMTKQNWLATYCCTGFKKLFRVLLFELGCTIAIGYEAKTCTEAVNLMGRKTV